MSDSPETNQQKPSSAYRINFGNGGPGVQAPPPQNPVTIPSVPASPMALASAFVLEANPGMSAALTNLTAAFAAGMQMLQQPVQSQLAFMTEQATAARATALILSTPAPAASSPESIAIADKIVDALSDKSKSNSDASAQAQGFEDNPNAKCKC